MSKLHIQLDASAELLPFAGHRASLFCAQRVGFESNEEPLEVPRWVVSAVDSAACADVVLPNKGALVVAQGLIIRVLAPDGEDLSTAATLVDAVDSDQPIHIAVDHKPLNKINEQPASGVTNDEQGSQTTEAAWRRMIGMDTQ